MIEGLKKYRTDFQVDRVPKYQKKTTLIKFQQENTQRNSDRFIRNTSQSVENASPSTMRNRQSRVRVQLQLDALNSMNKEKSHVSRGEKASTHDN